MRCAGGIFRLLCALLLIQALPAQSLSGNSTLDASERQRVLEKAVADLKLYYFDHDRAEKIADALLAHERAGDYNSVTDRQAFANVLVRDLIDASHDLHFTVEYTRNVFPDFSKPPPPDVQSRYQSAMAHGNCGFEKIEIRLHNLGYLKLNSFAEVAVCQSKAESTMKALNHVDALIFDLRDNRGGNGNMAVFLAGFFFDHSEYMFDPREPVTEQNWTRSPVAGSLLMDKPLYILTSSRTYSAAEQFSYDLKMLKRATLVGETTGGASHQGVLHNLDDHFAIGIPEHRPVNPYSDKDWAVAGVEPDVKVGAADALAAGEKLAQRKLQKK